MSWLGKRDMLLAFSGQREVRDAIKHPTKHRMAAHSKELSGPKMSTVTGLRNTAFDYRFHIGRDLATLVCHCTSSTWPRV